MKKWLMWSLTAVLLIISSNALAQESDSTFTIDEPIIDNPNDLGVQVLRGVLGDVVNIISGGDLPTEPDTILGYVMQIWCFALFTVSTFLVGFAAFKWFFGSIHSGKLNEQKFDATGVPIRLVIALVSVVPLGAGYCFYQLAHIYITGHSLSVANNLNNAIIRNMSVNSFRHATLPDKSHKLAAQAFETLVCANGINAAEGAETGEPIIGVDYIEKLSDGDEGTDIYGIKYGDIDDSWYEFGGYSENVCAEYTIEYTTPDFRMTTDGSAENDLLNANYQALISLFNHMAEPAANFVNKVYVEKASGEELALAKLEAEQALKHIASLYKQDIEFARQSYANKKDQELKRPDDELPQYLKSTPSFLDNFDIKDVGFIGLGATWWIDSIRTQSFTNMMNSMEVHGSELDDKAMNHEDLKDLWAMTQIVTDGQSGRVSITSIGSSESIEREKDRVMETMVSASLSMVQETNDPLFALMELGHEMITTAEALSGLLLTTHMLKEINDNLSNVDTDIGIPFIGSIANATKALITGMGEGTFELMGKMLMLLLGLLFTMGFYLAYYIPTIPLMHWLGGVIGAFSAALEQIILAPIHGVSHAFTDGQGFVGDRAKQGYILAFGAFLRFPMLVISFIVVYPFLLMMGHITFLLWTPFAESMSSTTTTGLVGFFGLTAALIAVCVSVIERVFSIMHEINDKALRALGHGADSMGTQGFVHSGSSQFTTMQSTISKAPEAITPSTPALKPRQDDIAKP